nr:MULTISPECIES: aldehyde dehydrogenase family protein [unclassified Martelella]
MRSIDQIYIDGDFAPATGEDVLDIINPATEKTIGTYRMASREDARRGVAAAKRAQPRLAATRVSERIEMLRSLQSSVLARTDDIRDATIEEYGGPVSRAKWISQYSSDCFGFAAETLASFAFERRAGVSTVHMEPVGVSTLIAPWNASAGTICSKLASALAAGCASVIKPSELSGMQNQVVAEALHAAGLPPGAINIVTGRGNDVGDELTTNPDVRRVSFTGSTATGKVIAKAGIDTMKRVTLAMSGKSPAILLDDAEFSQAIPMALSAGFQNNGQACIAGTRILVPRARLKEANEIVQSSVAAFRVGDPADPGTTVGPVASATQFERIQRYIAAGLSQGASLLAGGPGKPEGLDAGFFVKPTIFTEVTNDMDIARDEIFGPVLVLIPYDGEENAVRIANDSLYGLEAYIYSANLERAQAVARRIHAGTVLINRTAPDLLAPFGGVRQSGIGREFGTFGIESFLEAKTITLA